MLDLKAAITPAPNSTEAAEVQDNRSASEDSGMASPGKLFSGKSLSSLRIWVCLKIGYIPNYSHLIGIIIINHWV